MNLHEVLLIMAEQHQRIKGGGFSDLLFFNHKTKTISNGKTVLVKEGKIIPQKIELTYITINLDDDWGFVNEEFYSGMERRYEPYYRSLPTEHDRFVRSLFMAKAMNKYTSYEEMMSVSCNRALARYELEWFFMASSVNGNIKWFNDEHWYWKSPVNNKLIIYKEFI